MRYSSKILGNTKCLLTETRRYPFFYHVRPNTVWQVYFWGKRHFCPRILMKKTVLFSKKNKSHFCPVKSSKSHFCPQVLLNFKPPIFAKVKKTVLSLKKTVLSIGKNDYEYRSLNHDDSNSQILQKSHKQLVYQVSAKCYNITGGIETKSVYWILGF